MKCFTNENDTREAILSNMTMAVVIKKREFILKV